MLTPPRSRLRFKPGRLHMQPMSTPSFLAQPHESEVVRRSMSRCSLMTGDAVVEMPARARPSAIMLVNLTIAVGRSDVGRGVG